MATVRLPSPHLRRSVLIFDDDVEIAALAKARFERERCEVHTANDRASFLDGLAGKPDLILLDLSMKDLDGVEAFSLIAARHPRADILLFSGHSDEVISHARRLGEQSGLKILGLLRKPFTRRDVLEALHLPPPQARPSGPRLELQGSNHLLDEAIGKGWLEFWYQPKVSLRTGEVVGAECLARVQHPRFGLLAPASFLTQASESNLLDLTKCALKDAVRLASELKDRTNFQLSINVAGNLLHHTQLLDDLLDICRKPQHTGRLTLELTETDFVEDPINMQRFATRAVLHGFRISIDDFGHGYANFDRLRTAPFSELKIDRSVTLGCSADRELKTLCRAAAALAHGFKAEAVAEGVDNWADLLALRELSFDVAQGYLFSPPVQRDCFSALPRRYEFPALGRGRDMDREISRRRVKPRRILK